MPIKPSSYDFGPHLTIIKSFLHECIVIKALKIKSLAWAQNYKTFFILNSAEHEIYPAQKY